MNWKLIVFGGLAMYVVMFAVSMATGPLIHEGILDPIYMEYNDFWRPELRQDPPDLGALMPRWISVGLLTTFAMAGIYGAVYKAFEGAAWLKGLKYGIVLSIFNCCVAAGWSGIFALPDKIWIVWGLESFLYYLPGGALLGWLHSKFLS